MPQNKSARLKRGWPCGNDENAYRVEYKKVSPCPISPVGRNENQPEKVSNNKYRRTKGVKSSNFAFGGNRTLRERFPPKA
jgi:hypothetical protein